VEHGHNTEGIDKLKCGQQNETTCCIQSASLSFDQCHVLGCIAIYLLDLQTTRQPEREEEIHFHYNPAYT